ncbi:hypothetical protein AXG93_2947s1020 [Marchantia polymorpha subsp. ruderalis]|uniref:Uncharacterized protein n=1 Tax=Marchantia polymorpha subsp. ruderalis TaxID=1480154 RepID=A0A176WRN5_MARPO|nr:hypothetical protein AXG93_2947s1020 [Marchantia polymorpha subsp. ruderalis]
MELGEDGGRTFDSESIKRVGLLTTAEQKKFPLQAHVENGDETLGANDIDTDQEDTQLALPSERVDGPWSIRQRRRTAVEEKKAAEGRSFEDV